MIWMDQQFPNLRVYENQLEGFLKYIFLGSTHSFEPICQSKGPRVCLSNPFPGDTQAADLGPHLENENA